MPAAAVGMNAAAGDVFEVTMRASLLNAAILTSTTLLMSATSDSARAENFPLSLPLRHQTAEKEITFAEHLRVLSERYKIYIVADAFAGEDFTAPLSRWKGRSAEDILKAVAEWRERDVMKVGNIYVLRHKRWAWLYKAMQNPGYPLRWKGEGELSVTRLDKPKPEDFILPARELDLTARDVACSRLAAALRETAAWNVRVSPEVGARRVHIHARGVAPSRILDALGVLLYAGPEVVLRPSDEQKRLENYTALGFPEREMKRLKLSDELRGDLEKLLTLEQRQSIESGKFVTLSVGSLPLHLQQRALEYVNASAALFSDLVSAPDASQWQKFQIRFRPQSAGIYWRELGVKTIAPGGHEFYF